MIENALKYSPEGSEVFVGVEKRGGSVVFTVKDEGVGLSAEDIEKLFTPFPDIHVETVSHGSGLGLSICKGIVELHGGSIWAESEGHGKGSSFIFSIPLVS